MLHILAAYRTVSEEAVRVLAGLSPVELLVEDRIRRRGGSACSQLQVRLMEDWQVPWDTLSKGRWN